MTRLAALSLLCGFLVLTPGTADDKKLPPPEPAKSQRALFAVKNADPATLAETISRHFQGEAVALATPAGSGNAVLVSGTAAAVPEAVKLLEQLDRKPRTVEVDITLAEVPATKDGKDVTAADLLAADGLGKDGKGQRIKLTAVEGHPVTSTTGGNKPVTTGAVAAGGFGGGRGGQPGAAQPFVQRSVSYMNVGTTVTLTARVGADDAVTLDLSVQDSKVRAAEDEGAAAMANNTLSTKLCIPTGKAVVAQSVRADGKAGPTVSVVLVSARVVADRVASRGK